MTEKDLSCPREVNWSSFNSKINERPLGLSIMNTNLDEKISKKTKCMLQGHVLRSSRCLFTTIINVISFQAMN